MNKDAYKLTRSERDSLETRVPDEAMRLWRECGGDQHGPNVEHVSMPMCFFANFLERYIAAERARVDRGIS